MPKPRLDLGSHFGSIDWIDSYQSIVNSRRRLLRGVGPINTSYGDRSPKSGNPTYHD